MVLTSDEERELQRLLAKSQVSAPASSDTAGMSDASKRRLSSSKAAGYTSEDGWNSIPYPKEPTSIEGPAEEEFNAADRKVTHLFPPDIRSMDAWGATVLEFGKHAGKTYLQVAQDPDLQSYGTWCRKHLTKAPGKDVSSDFGCYLRAYDVAYGEEKVTVIRGTYPGTDTARRLRRP